MKTIYFYLFGEQKLIVREPKGKVLLEKQCSLDEARLILKQDFNCPNAFEENHTASQMTWNVPNFMDIRENDNGNV